MPTQTQEKEIRKMARTEVNEVIITKNVRGFELSEPLAKSAEKLIKSVTKSEVGTRELAKTLYEIQEQKLLKDSEFKGVCDFFESITGLSASSASQYLKTFKAFKNYDDDKWSSLSAIVPFSMLTEMAKLYGLVKHTEVIIDDGKRIEQAGNTAESGNGLLKAFAMIVQSYDDVPRIDLSNDESIVESVKEILLYISKEWSNKEVREAIESSDIVVKAEKEKEKKGKKKDSKKDSKNTKPDGDDGDDEDDELISDITELVQEYEKATAKQMSKAVFIEKMYELLGLIND